MIKLKNSKFKNFLRIFVGVLFALLLIPFMWLIFFGIAKGITFANAKLPKFASVTILVLLLLLIVFTTALSKIYIGSGSVKFPQMNPVRRITEMLRIIKLLVFSYMAFLPFSFINFVISIIFVREIVFVVLFNTVLNLIPIYLISRYLNKKLHNNRARMFFWILTIISSILLPIPYGEFVLSFFISLL